MLVYYLFPHAISYLSTNKYSFAYFWGEIFTILFKTDTTCVAHVRVCIEKFYCVKI